VKGHCPRVHGGETFRVRRGRKNEKGSRFRTCLVQGWCDIGKEVSLGNRAYKGAVHADVRNVHLAGTKGSKEGPIWGLGSGA